MKAYFARSLCGLALFGWLLVGTVASDGAQINYRPLKSIPIGGEGGWDYLEVDSSAHRLYVSHATKVVVIDTATDTVVGEVADTPGVHGIVVAPDLGRGFTSNGRENKVGIFDVKTLQPIAKVETGGNPDAILYESKRAGVYAFNGRSHSATVIDARTAKVLATIPLGGKPEFAVEDPDRDRIFVNIEDTSELVAIDAARREVVARWPIAPGEEASGLAIDVTHHRLFLGCANKLMVMMDDNTGKVLGSVPIGAGVDACKYDPVTQLAFASCGAGTTTIARADGTDALTVVQTLKTARGARTMALDPATHKIYLSAAEYPPGAAGERRPQPMAGSFKVLVFGPERGEVLKSRPAGEKAN